MIPGFCSGRRFDSRQRRRPVGNGDLEAHGFGDQRLAPRPRVLDALVAVGANARIGVAEHRRQRHLVDLRRDDDRPTDAALARVQDVRLRRGPDRRRVPRGDEQVHVGCRFVVVEKSVEARLIERVDRRVVRRVRRLDRRRER